MPVGWEPFLIQALGFGNPPSPPSWPLCIFFSKCYLLSPQQSALFLESHFSKQSPDAFFFPPVPIFFPPYHLLFLLSSGGSPPFLSPDCYFMHCVPNKARAVRYVSPQHLDHPESPFHVEIHIFLSPPRKRTVVKFFRFMIINFIFARSYQPGSLSPDSFPVIPLALDLLVLLMLFLFKSLGSYFFELQTKGK